MSLLTQSGHRGCFQFALQQTLGRFIPSLGAGPAAMLAPRSFVKHRSICTRWAAGLAFVLAVICRLDEFTSTVAIYCLETEEKPLQSDPLLLTLLSP
jgi:hypothetical protein